MLRVVDLASGTALSCSLTAESTASQVVVALRKRRSLLVEDDAVCAIYGVWADSKQQMRARRLRGDDRPLLLVTHLKRTTGAAPKLAFTQGTVSSRLLLARTGDERKLFADRGIKLDSPHDSEFFTVIQRLGAGDLCGYLFTNSTDIVTSKAESSLKFWVLHGERLWVQPSHEEEHRHFVPLADNKVAGPWTAEFELQTTLAAYRFIAPTAGDAKAWVDALNARIQLATENELIACADVLIADEERARWKKTEAMLNRLDSLDGWCASGAGTSQLCRFARSDGSEYLLLFFLDGRATLKSASANPTPVAKRFMSLAALPPALQPLRAEIIAMLAEQNGQGVSREVALNIIESVKRELEGGMMQRLMANCEAYDRYVSEMPLLVSYEQQQNS